MPSPDICACVTSSDDLGLAIAVRDNVSLYEVRIDLIGENWPEVAARLPLPWIACNRMVSQGGSCSTSEDARLDELRRAVDLGASLVDVELTALGAAAFVCEVKRRARVIVSHHDFEQTAEEDVLAAIVEQEKEMGADICKVATTARRAGDVRTVLRIVHRFRHGGIVAFAMSPLGMVSRVLAPLAGASFTYASLAAGHEAAPGQLSVQELRRIYETIGAV